MDPMLNEAPGWRARFLLPDGTLPRLAGAEEPEATEEAPAEPENVETDSAPEAPAPEGEAPDPQSDEIDWESLTPEELRDGYLRRKDYTQKTQEIAPLRQLAEELGLEDPADREALFKALGEKLGYEIEELGEEDAEEPDEAPVEEDADEVEEPEAEEAPESDALDVDHLASLDEELGAIEQELDRPVTETEIELLGKLAVPTEDGGVDLRSGFAALQKYVTEQRLAWQASKTDAPAVISEGQSGDPAPDLDTQAGREARMAEVIAATNANA